MKALLIIDMQKGSFRPYTLRHDTLAIIGRINRMTAAFREHHYPVIFIQHDGTKENTFLPGSDDWQLLPEMTTAASDIFVGKTANDAFYNSDLQQVLSEHAIHELYITGCATDFCVDTTIKSALSKDYKITVAADGHTTASRPFADAVTLIHHYNWMWNDMTPTAHKIEVMDTNELMKLLP